MISSLPPPADPLLIGFSPSCDPSSPSATLRPTGFSRSGSIGTAGGLQFSQEAFIDSILDRYRMSDCTPITTPMEPGLHLRRPMGEEEGTTVAAPYQSLVGSLLYLANKTRPDLSYVVAKLAKYNSCFGQQHWDAARRVLKYLKGTRNLALTYPAKCDLTIVGYCDSDWAGEKDTRTLYHRLHLSSRRQPGQLEGADTRPTCTFRHGGGILCSNGGNSGSNFPESSILSSLGLPQSPITIYTDNRGLIDMLKPDYLLSQRTKHIDLRFHFIRNAIERGLVHFEHVPSDENKADFLTKPLPRIKLEHDRGFFLQGHHASRE